MKKVFYVEIKNTQGEYEPLGIMTMQQAIEIAWERDHAAIQMSPIDMSYIVGAAGR